MLDHTQGSSLFFAAVCAFFAMAGHAQDAAEPQDQTLTYQNCMDKVLIHPQAAFDEAVQWEGLGGGHAARHCALAALVEIGHYLEAAQGFEKLAQDVRADAGLKVQILVQGARAWIAADQPNKAITIMDTALDLVPHAINARLVRARAMGMLRRFHQAQNELDAILSANPSLVEALVMRGSVFRQTDDLAAALRDLNSALILAPDHPEGLLERGIVHRLESRKSEARTDWQMLIDTHPDTEAARLAANNLHKLNSGAEQ